MNVIKQTNSALQEKSIVDLKFEWAPGLAGDGVGGGADYLNWAQTPSPLRIIAAGQLIAEISCKREPAQHAGIFRSVATVEKLEASQERALSALSALCLHLRQRNLDELRLEVPAQYARVIEQLSGQPAQKTADEKVAAIVKLVQPCHIPGSDITIGPGHPCFVIAEAGSNWRMGTPTRDMKMAKALIDVALEAGANAVKFQTYRPDTVYVENAGDSDYLSENGIKESIIDIFKDLAMPYEMLAELAHYCGRQGILFMSTPFSRADFEAVDPHVSVHKIASYEISHIRLLECAAASGKPLLLSTGASGLDDIAWAVDTFRSLSNQPLCLMQCTARYPAPNSSLNLGTIPLLKAMFGVPVGLSDHSRDPVIGAATAVALGANLIEKHYTLDNRLPGPDHMFALTPAELKQMVNAIRAAEEVRGYGGKDVLTEEEELYWYARRGLQATRPIAQGEKFEEGKNFDILRPGKQKRGIHPRFVTDVAAATATRALKPGEGIQPGDYAK